jgi:hypothetical protein
MPFSSESTRGLAADVNALLAESGESLRVGPIAEIEAASRLRGGAQHLLYTIGWMTAGPPSLSAETIAGAGLWAFLRYGWAFEDSARHVAVRREAVAIRGRNRAVFSEAAGIGASAHILARGVFPEGPVLVADLDDAGAELTAAGFIHGLPSNARRPDYLIARLDGSGGWSLAVLECKGTVSDRHRAVEQLKTGALQAASVTSRLPLRRFAMATALHLDEDVREIVSYGVELVSGPGDDERAAAHELPEGLIDATLVRKLRVLGRFEEAAEIGGLGDGDVRGFLAAQFSDGRTGGQVPFNAGTREMVGRRLVLDTPEGIRVAEIGVDLWLLRAMLAPTDRSILVTEELLALQKASRISPDFPDEPAVLFRDGTALSWQGADRAAP